MEKRQRRILFPFLLDLSAIYLVILEQVTPAAVSRHFATTDLSVRFRDACQGGGAYGKTATPRSFSPSFLI
ncbi:hypothetical protein [Salmonella enterica]